MTKTIDRPVWERPVRVTIEGTGRPVGHDPDLMRLDYNGSVLLVNVANDGVTVENIDPPRVWTDGDVVQIDTGRILHTYTRSAGSHGDTYPWASTGDSMSDVGMTSYVDNPSPAGWTVRVLRYQAGE